MGYHLIDTQETLWIDRALHRLLPNPNIHILGNTSVRRQPILSFLIQTTSLDRTAEASEKGVFMWKERATRKDKPLHGRFVTKLLNDLFGIQARGGCACAGPYGHVLLGVNVQQSLAFRSAIQKVMPRHHLCWVGWLEVEMGLTVPSLVVSAHMKLKLGFGLIEFATS